MEIKTIEQFKGLPDGAKLRFKLSGRIVKGVKKKSISSMTGEMSDFILTNNTSLNGTKTRPQPNRYGYSFSWIVLDLFDIEWLLPIYADSFQDYVKLWHEI